ncbi:hypothetical protein KCV07_g93, partial [Aureobasidium melanogenum]
MSDINNLPIELVLETFSYLDLKDLVRCVRVNKFSKAITEHSAFDKIFFRTKVIKPGDPIDLDKLQINPALNELCYTCRYSIKEAQFLRGYTKLDGKDDVRELPLIDSSVAFVTAAVIKHEVPPNNSCTKRRLNSPGVAAIVGTIIHLNEKDVIFASA